MANFLTPQQQQQIQKQQQLMFGLRLLQSSQRKRQDPNYREGAGIMQALGAMQGDKQRMQSQFLQQEQLQMQIEAQRQKAQAQQQFQQALGRPEQAQYMGPPTPAGEYSKEILAPGTGVLGGQQPLSSLAGPLAGMGQPAQAMSLLQPGKPYTLTPGDVRFGAGNQQVASVPGAVKPPPVIEIGVGNNKLSKAVWDDTTQQYKATGKPYDKFNPTSPMERSVNYLVSKGMNEQEAVALRSGAIKQITDPARGSTSVIDVIGGVEIGRFDSVTGNWKRKSSLTPSTADPIGLF